MSEISRRQFLGTSAAALAARRLGAAAGKKNVLFIAVDDLRPELNCYGATQIQSPNIDRLAAQGVRFDRAYCQQAVCAPSRISLMTGMRPDSTGVHDLSHPLSKTSPNALSVARHFKNNGYETISLGKIYHHYGDDLDAWSEPDWHPKRDEWFGWWQTYVEPESKRIGKKLYEDRVRDFKEGRRPRMPQNGYGPPFESPEAPDNIYPDGMVADRAVQELRRLRDKPFFLAAGFVKPHLPFNAPKKYWDLYDPPDIEIPDQRHYPVESPKIGHTNWGEMTAYAGIPPAGAPVPDDLARKLIHGYYACVSYMDAQVGKLLDGLEENGLADKTAIVLWGDHGWKLADYGAWCKHTNFEIDTHVPMIFSDPDHRSSAGKGTSALSEFVDIYPTLSELCGLPMPEHCEGLSAVPLLSDPGRQWKQAAFSQYPRQGQAVMGYSMRTERYRYTEWIERASGDVIAKELYDHSEGPVVTKNLIWEPERQEVIARLSAMLRKGKGWKRVRKAVEV